MIFLFASLVLSAVLIGMLVYRYDLYDREPWPLVGTTVLAGAAAMKFISRAELATVELLGPTEHPEMLLEAVAAIEEEAVRFAIVLGVAVLASRHFNDPLDGLVYGSFAGLGMGIEESLHFAFLGGAPSLATGAAALIRLLGHAVLGGIGGFGVGVLRFRLPRWPSYLLGCLALAILLHFSWDWIVVSSSTFQESSRWPVALALAVMLTGLFAFGRLVLTGAEWSRQVFAPVRARSIWRWPFSARAPGKTDRK